LELTIWGSQEKRKQKPIVFTKRRTGKSGLTRNHRFGGGEGQAGKLGRDRQSGDRKSGRASIETLETSGATDSERRFAKVMSGGSVRALPRCSEKSPKELKA
jgi:hypothetical protein